MANQVLQLLVRTPKSRHGLGFDAAGSEFRGHELTDGWQVAETTGSALNAAEAWDVAHEAARASDAFVEPDLEQAWPWPQRATADFAARPGEAGHYEDQSPRFPLGPGFAWHLGDEFTQLARARKAIEDLGERRSPVRIGILDVGFDFTHKAIPRSPLLRLDLQRNFVKDGRPANDASDPFHEGFLKNPGHGTGTLSILAGPVLSGMTGPGQDGVILGADPLAEIIPCRIGTSVVLARTSAFVEAVKYLMAPNGDRALRADVISMSMGGVASAAWADVVNAAYEAGIVIVTAAGNNFGLPKGTVFPARFNRVIAVCGVMADHSPYLAPLGTMSGNFGPPSKMRTALAAYTPNIAWAEVNAGSIVDMDGEGTSSATPQIAGAAALWLAMHKRALADRPGWHTVESVRHALFSSARKPPGGDALHLGQGILQAYGALGVGPVTSPAITRPDSASFAFLKLLERPLGMAPDSNEMEMLALEATQLFQRDPVLEEIYPDPGEPFDALPEKEQRRFFDAVIASRFASRRLRERFAEARGARFRPLPGTRADAGPGSGASAGGPGRAEEMASPRAPREHRIWIPKPAMRRLRVYGFDPSLSQQLETVDLNEATISIPWEPIESNERLHPELRLQPGPVGEYVEVVDHDPASGAFYAPVDLQDPQLLATDGLAPSVGDPQFHQQMVYAVAMRTIHNFEVALGRRAMWAPRREDGKARFVRRLRIYPHALRERNAYYHPEKKALLFGYFPASGDAPELVLPSGLVFTCLSHDVVAHETTHALLDGLHRRFNRPTNEDMLALHEAFADIVAVFQHFSLPGVLEARIASGAGGIGSDRLLGTLAQEFGRGIGLREALRSAITLKRDEIDPTAPSRVHEPHDRGAILLAAVFDAFVRIYEHRSREVIRAATGGNAELPAGSVNRDLARLLAKEAAKSAQHVLTICIRALDYCPPVDPTFGDYLRALITADADVMPSDDNGYRVAFIEAFRLRGIYPRDVRSMSVESLLWRRPSFLGLVEDLGLTDLVRSFADQAPRFYSRDRLFDYGRMQAARIEKQILAGLQALSPGRRREAACELGMDEALPFRVDNLRLAEKTGQYGRVVPQVILTLIQERQATLGGNGAGPSFPFEGGATVIVDPRYLTVRYAVAKNIASSSRENAQRAFLRDGRAGLRATYLADNPNERFAMLHRGG